MWSFNIVHNSYLKDSILQIGIIFKYLEIIFNSFDYFQFFINNIYDYLNILRIEKEITLARRNCIFVAKLYFIFVIQ